MTALLYTALIFVIAGGLVAAFLLLKNKKARSVLYMTAAIALIAVFFLRFLWARSAYHDVFLLRFIEWGSLGRVWTNVRPPYGPTFGNQLIPQGLVLISMLLLWFNLAGLAAVVLSAFFNVPFVSKAITYIFAPIAFLSAVFFFASAVMIGGTYTFDGFNIRTLFFAFELGLMLGLSAIHAVYYLLKRKSDADIKKQDKREWIALAFVLPIMLLLAMPNNMIHILFGHGSVTNALDLTFSHRLILYFSIIVPFGLYFGIKKLDSVFVRQKCIVGAEASTFSNDEHEKNVPRDDDGQGYVTQFRGSHRPYHDFIRYCLIFISLSAMIVYSEMFPFTRLTSLRGWPLHLCNTAMFIIPVCLIFKLEKVFYFTFFINVLGAFLANLMPNYSGAYNLSYNFYSYWQNHYFAFFLPLLCVALGIFSRPRLKHFGWSMIFFAVYFVFILFINAYLTTSLYRADFFFLNGDHIIEFFPDSWRVLMDTQISFQLGYYYNIYGYRVPNYLTFYIFYQIVFFAVFTAAAALMWLIYEYYFSAWHRLRELFNRKKRINMDIMALMSQYNLESLSDPINPQGGDMLKLINFSKKYGSNKNFAVENANLEVKAGEIFGFLGPNGAGKSTIIKSLVGLQPITDGQMQVCGFDVEKQSIETKKRIGYVPDHYALYEKLTGREYVNYVADLYGIEKERRDELLDHYLSIFQLKHAFDNQMRTYSHGMKQKIAIMAALIHSPKVWILDEPLTGLDPNSIFQVKQIMKEHAEAGNIVMFSSHIMDVAERICDKIAIIRKGKILVENKNVSDLEGMGISLEHYYMYTIKHGVPPESSADIVREGNALALELN